MCEARLPSVNLIMEPLRRPNTLTAEESRRVPPLRIRLPQRREPRQRRPARMHDYSPPLPVSRTHRFDETLKKRAVATSVESSGDISAEARQKKWFFIFSQLGCLHMIYNYPSTLNNFTLK